MTASTRPGWPIARAADESEQRLDAEGLLPKPSTIRLHSGAHLDLLVPNYTLLTLTDIAHGLSHLCRFTGQCDRFYSVAEHSVLVSQLVAPEHAFPALMHDAAEAFIGDVAKPLKILLPEYAIIEERMEAAIAKRFILPYPMHPDIKKADLQMLAVERRALFSARSALRPIDEMDLPDVQIECMPPREAKAAFLRRATQILFELE